jgi:DNA-binding response OmpR family regulator
VEGAGVTDEKTRVLIVEDDVPTLELLRMRLERDGYEVTVASSGQDALRQAYAAHPDVVILDVILPGMDGFEVCRLLREMTEVVILFVTVKGRKQDIIRGLQLGADDYLTKPYDYQELLARLTASLRRVEHDLPPPVLFSSGDRVTVGDPSRRQVLVNDRKVTLTPKEFKVLCYLMKNTGRVMSAEAILANAWGPEYAGDRQLVKEYIYRLRKKLEPGPGEPRYLLTVRGSGYVFEGERAHPST